MGLDAERNRDLTITQYYHRVDASYTGGRKVKDTIDFGDWEGPVYSFSPDTGYPTAIAASTFNMAHPMPGFFHARFLCMQFVAFAYFLIKSIGEMARHRCRAGSSPTFFHNIINALIFSLKMYTNWHEA